MQKLDMNFLKENPLRKVCTNHRGNFYLVYAVLALVLITLVILLFVGPPVALDLTAAGNFKGVKIYAVMIAGGWFIPYLLFARKGDTILKAIKKGRFYLLEDEIIRVDNGEMHQSQDSGGSRYVGQRMEIHLAKNRVEPMEIDALLYGLFESKLQQVFEARNRKVYLFIVDTGRKKYLEDIYFVDEFVLCDDAPLADKRVNAVCELTSLLFLTSHKVKEKL